MIPLHFKTVPLLLLLALGLMPACVTEFKPIQGTTVPTNYEEAFIELDHMLTADQKESLENGETPVEELVLTFGMQLKEYWGLWRDSKMAKFMRKRDIDHPDQMITAIFSKYIDYLRSK